MLVKRQILLAEIESTYGTDPTPTGTDAVEVENLRVIQHEGLRMTERPSMRATVGSRSKVYGGSLRRLTFDVEIKGSGSAGTPPEFDVLLRACGMGVTNVPATSDTYAPVSTAYESCTIYAQADENGTTALQHRFTGCRGSFNINWETGVQGKISFNMVGHLDGESDVSTVTPTYDTTAPSPFLSAGYTQDAFGAVINALALDSGQQLEFPPDANAADGYAEIQIVGRECVGSVDPEMELLATMNPFTDFRAGTTIIVGTGVIGSGAGNQWQFNAPTAQITDISDGDRNGVLVYDMPLLFTEGVGDLDFTLAFT